LECGIGVEPPRQPERGAGSLGDLRTSVIPAGTVIELGLDCELLAMEQHVQREAMLQHA
jgi:hypothetical protein